VVIIDRGRLITQGPVETVVAHMGSQLVVRSPDADRLAELLQGADATVTRPTHERLVVSGLGSEDVGRIAAANNLILFELREQGVSLEETFLALTAKEDQR